MPSCRPAFPRLCCQCVKGEVREALGLGLPAILRPGPGPKPCGSRKRQSWGVGSGGGWGPAGTPRKERPAGAGGWCWWSLGEMNRPTRGLSSPQLPHKGLGYTTGCGGPGATGGRGEAILRDTLTPGLCTPRKGPWAGSPVSRVGSGPAGTWISREEGNPPNLLASVSPIALSLASFPNPMPSPGICPLSSSQQPTPPSFANSQ